MIQPNGYVATCDHREGCDAHIEAPSRFGDIGLLQLMEKGGWQRGVKKNGEPATRGGKDYCANHRVGGS
jgi:hypothetical protein